MPDLPKKPFTKRLLTYPLQNFTLDDALERAAANSGGGGFVYQSGDNQTFETALTITAGTRHMLQMKADGPLTEDSFLDTIKRADPPGYALLTSSGKFQPELLGDIYNVKLAVEAAVVAQTEENTGILIEYEILLGGVTPLNVHERFSKFEPDAGMLEREKNDNALFRDKAANDNVIHEAIRDAFVLLNTLGVLDGPIAAINSALATGSQIAATAVLRTISATDRAAAAWLEAQSGQAFTEETLIVNTANVNGDGITFYMTPNVDIKIWNIRLICARINSPTE